MVVEGWISLLVFSLVVHITPGPNTLMLMVSGVRFGFYRTWPHLIGILLGVFTLFGTMGLGLKNIIGIYPQLQLILKIAGSLYLFYLAYRIAFSGALGDTKADGGRPVRFVEALGFQWVNPKAWAAALSLAAIYTTDTPASSIWVTSVFTLVGLPCCVFWIAFGRSMGGWLSEPRRARWFNICAGLTLVACVLPILAAEL